MTRLSRILKDYRQTGAVASLIALWGFLDDTTFLTKAGALGQVYRLRGVDAECLDHAERRAVVHRLERALRQLDEAFRVYQYLIKRPAVPVTAAAHPHPVVNAALANRASWLNGLDGRAGPLFDIELYLVVMYEGWRYVRPSLRDWLSSARVAAVLSQQLAEATSVLHHKSQAFTAQLADTAGPTLLQKPDAFRFFRALVNYAPHKIDVPLKYDTHLDFYAADSAIECYRDHLLVDGYRVKVLTMKEPPARTCAHMLEGLIALPASFVACFEWQRLANDKVRRDLHARRRHFFNQKVSFVNYISPQTRPDEMLVDESATATVQELGQSLTALDVNGDVFGACSLTLVLYDEDAGGGRSARRIDDHVAACVKTFAGHDGALYEESYNLMNAWLACVPGNASYNLRRLALLNTNAADLSLIFTSDAGARTSAHLEGRPCLAVFETEQQTPYAWNLHCQDVGHTLIQGATGSGKSFLTAFILTHAQQYEPITVIFDLGGSYEALVRRLGGSTWRMGLADRPFTINPFCLEPTREHLHFLFSFTRVLIQSNGQHRLTQAEDRDLYDAVESVYALDPPQRRLFTLANILPRGVAGHLQRWVQGGPYADLFDHAEDTLTFQQLQAFDFEGLERFPLVLEPLLFYVLHRASA